MTVRNAAELFALDGERFVQASYRALLGRGADGPGLVHHLGALNAGASKLQIVEDFLRSDEGKNYGGVLPGLAEALIEAKLESLEEVLAMAGAAEEGRALLDYVSLLARAPVEVTTPAPQERFVAEVEPGKVGPNLLLLDEMPHERAGPSPSLWYDLTDLFQQDQDAAGAGMQLVFMAQLRRVRGMRFLIQVDDVVVEAETTQFDWLFRESFMADAFLDVYGRGDIDGPRALEVYAPQAGTNHPCQAGDIVVTWASVGKSIDRILGRASAGAPDAFKLCHVFSDQSLAALQAAWKPFASGDRIDRYVRWLAFHSHALIFTSDSAEATMAALQAKVNAPSPPHATLRGLGQVGLLDDASATAVITELGIVESYALYIGAVDSQSNLETVYRGWLLARELGDGAAPNLVLALSGGSHAQNLLEAMQVDPRLHGKLLILRPSARELAALLTHATFLLCPATGRGAAAARYDAIRLGKASIVADAPDFPPNTPANMVRVHAIDVRGWANAILDLAAAPPGDVRIDDRASSEAAEANSQTLARLLDQVKKGVQLPAIEAPTTLSTAKPTIWMDLTLTFLDWGGHITGIVRAELTFAYYLKKLAPETRFFAYTRGEPGYFFEIEEGNLTWLFEAVDLSESYRNFNAFWKHAETTGEGHRDPFRVVGHPVPSHPAYIGRFPSNSIVFFAAIDQDGTGRLSRCPDVLPLVDDRQAAMTSQLIYDLTPFLMPQVHHEFTVRGYTPFVEFVSNHFDHLVYGGRTAQRDAIRIQLESGWRSPPSTFVEFGSDISLSGDSVLPPTQRARSIDNEKRILKRLGITGAFVITVGSLEPRKNHEILYKAYLELLERDSLNTPLQMVFIGKRGWKIDDLLATIEADERVRGKLLILSPSDEELEALYHQCSFTLLPSFYEGWSLTLPESLSYGKFCLVSDVDPLREAGGDLVEYIHPLDTMAWADRIENYVNHPEELAQWERKIRQGWHPRTWHEASASLIERLRAAHAERYPY